MAVYQKWRIGTGCRNILVGHILCIRYLLNTVQGYTEANKTKHYSFTHWAYIIDIDNCIRANLYENSYINRKTTCLLKWIFFEVDPGYVLPVEIQSNNC